MKQGKLFNEPIYITHEDDFSGPHGDVREDFRERVKGVPAVRGCWWCPWCELGFERRNPCERHMGLDGVAASCVMANNPGNRFMLNAEEWDDAMREGELRDTKANLQGRKPAYGCKPEDTLKRNKQGVPAEMVFCKFGGLIWKSTEGSFNKADFLGRFQIRTRGHRDWDLPVHPPDHDDWVMVLILPVLPESDPRHIYDVVGWKICKECKQRRYWHDRYEPGRPAFWVPQTDLHDWRLLPAMIEEAKAQ